MESLVPSLGGCPLLRCDLPSSLSRTGASVCDHGWVFSRQLAAELETSQGWVPTVPSLPFLAEEVLGLPGLRARSGALIPSPGVGFVLLSDLQFFHTKLFARPHDPHGLGKPFHITDFFGSSVSDVIF